MFLIRGLVFTHEAVRDWEATERVNDYETGAGSI
jgi:hypothetical protein